MKISEKILRYLVSTVGMVGFYFAFLPSANAQIVCKSGTITNHANSQLRNCILAKKVTANVRVNNINSIFPCKAEQYIFFTEKGVFESCVLSEQIKITESGSVITCNSEMIVNLSIDSSGKKSVYCRPIEK